MPTLLFQNQAQTTLALAVAATDTVIYVAVGTGAYFPAPSANQAVTLTIVNATNSNIVEIVSCTNITGDALTVIRGQENTIASAWNSHDFVTNLMTAGTARSFVQAYGLASGIYPIALPIASTTSLGAVIVDGTSIVIDSNGVISASSISGVVSSFNTRTGAVTLVSNDVTTALAYTPYNATNPNDYQTASQVTTAITGYGYQTASQVTTAITGYGYQTAPQVTSAITSYGYQTAAQVTTAITGYGYQTAPQVTTAITSYGYQTAPQVTSAITSYGYQTAAQVTSAITSYGYITSAGSITGNAGTVTNGVYTTGSYANPSWITAIPYAILSGTGIVPIVNGGTGTATPTLSAGTNITISGSWPNQTINASGGSYTLPTASTTVLGGVKIDGTTITINGSGVISTGGSTGVSSFNGRTGSVTLTSNDVTTALTFTPYSTANPVGYQTAAQVTTAITSYGYITSSGTAANVSGIVAIANGGTGASTAATALTNLGAYPATNPNGYISSYSLPTASTTVLGGVKVDGTTITINGSGVISSTGGGGSGTVTSVSASGTNGLAATVTNPTTTPAISLNASALSGVSMSTQTVSDYMTFATVTPPAWAAGELFYSSSNDSLTFYNAVSGNDINLGQEIQIRVYNNTGTTIPVGSVVYINGQHSQFPTVDLARANDLVKSKASGMTNTAIPNNSYGYVVSIGKFTGFDTHSFSAGDILYLSATTGGTLTNVAPVSPNYLVSMGICLYSNPAQGVIELTMNAVTSLTAGTVTMSSQPAITSVGTLSGLTVTNPISGSVTGTASNVTGLVGMANIMPDVYAFAAAH